MARSRLDSLRALARLCVREPRTARTAFDAFVTSVRLRRHGLRPIIADISQGLPSATVGEARQAAVEIDRAMAALPLEPTCLRRSAALLRALDRRGLSGELVVGVRTDEEPDGFGAHAWVEIDGAVVNDDEDMRDRYVVITTGSDLQNLPAGLR